MRVAVVGGVLLAALVPLDRAAGPRVVADPAGPVPGRLLPIVAVLGATVATLGVASIRLVPPRFVVADDSALQTLIGWDITRPFSARSRCSSTGAGTCCSAPGALVLAGLYLAAVRRLAARGVRWPVGRTVAWLLGCATLLVATSSGLGFYSPSMFSVHMISHMTLKHARADPAEPRRRGHARAAGAAPAGRGNPPGPREWLLAAVHSRVAKVVTHPAFAAVLFVGSFYVLYFTPLFDGALRFHWTHQLMNLHFVLVGYLFLWPLIGVDAAPHRLPHLGRLAVMLATMPFHAFFGVAGDELLTVLGENFYRQVGLPGWTCSTTSAPAAGSPGRPVRSRCCW
nr:cytochrome c oxidase assembly protein [Pseudonocardia sp. ICBG601]